MENKKIIVTFGLLFAFLLVACGSEKADSEETVEKKVEKTEPKEEKKEVQKRTPPRKRDKAPSAVDIPAPEDVAAAPEDAEKTESGLASKVVKPGTGEVHPKATDMVKVHYTGWTTDGKMFDTSHKRGKPSEFPLNKVIAGWTEGVQLMVEGETRRFWIPEDLAYKGRRPPFGMLVFDVELVEIMK